MRVYNRQDFMNLPEGIIYTKGKPWYFGDMTVKGETITSGGKHIDWVCLNLDGVEANDCGQLTDRLDEMLKKGVSYPIETGYGRDGFYDKDDLFLVYERADLEKLKGFIETAMEKTA